MILIGQFDSPFVRRVGIALRLYAIPFEHRPWSVFGDAEKIRPINPLTRVPTLVLDDGDVLIDSAAILDFVDSLAPEGRALFPRAEPDRHRQLKIAALATGLADKAVSLFYEKRLHDVTSEIWSNRCRTQIGSALDALEGARAALSSPWWFGETFGHADIAVACALRFVREAHAGLIDWPAYPALSAHGAKMEALPVFAEISQPFIAPA
ncbi:MAG: glutathione S-transferase family protein [Phyllobacteriaceae bacterium]|nr:glutathione S-transferase family protein [Phyllobacteriaceae bacterium]